MTDLLILIIFCIFLFDVKFNLLAPNLMPLSHDKSKSLRGLFAILIVLIHISKEVSSGVIFPHVKLLSYSAVSIFFFISGLGLILSYMNKKGYEQKFLLLRLPNILIPYILVFILYYLVLKSIGYENTNDQLIQSLFKGNPLVSNSWYVIVITFLYILFYISIKYSKTNYSKVIIINCIGVLGYMILCYILGFDNWYYDSVSVFLLGLSYPFLSNRISKIFQVIQIRKIIVLIAGYLVFFILVYIINNFSITGVNLLVIIFSNVAALIFTLLILILSGYIEFKNKVFIYIGEISYEIYLIHGLWIFLLRNDVVYINNDLIYGALTLVLSILVSTILHYIFKIILIKYRILILK